MYGRRCAMKLAQEQAEARYREADAHQREPGAYPGQERALGGEVVRGSFSARLFGGCSGFLFGLFCAPAIVPL